METFLLFGEFESQKCSVPIGSSPIEMAGWAGRTTSCCKTRSCREGVSAAIELFACWCHLSHADNTIAGELTHARMELHGARMGWESREPHTQCETAQAPPVSCSTTILSAGPRDTWSLHSVDIPMYYSTSLGMSCNPAVLKKKEFEGNFSQSISARRQLWQRKGTNFFETTPSCGVNGHRPVLNVGDNDQYLARRIDVNYIYYVSLQRHFSPCI